MTADFKQGTNLVGKILASGQVQGSLVLSFTGSPTGGTFTPTVLANGVSVATAAQTYSAGYTAAALQTALQGLSNVGSGNATVTGSNGGPFTITFAPAVGPVQLSVSNSLTGGTSPAPVVTASDVTLYTVPAASAVKVATAILTNIGTSSVTGSVSVVPSGGSLDATRKVAVFTSANPLLAGDSVKLTEVEAAMLDAGAILSANMLIPNAINYLLTGSVSS